MTLEWIIRIACMLICSMGVRLLIIRPVIELKLSLKAQKRIKEGQTFKEWFLYSRYRELIPPLMIWWHFSNFIFCIIAAVIFVVWVLITGANENVARINTIFLAISAIPTNFVYIFFYTNSEQGVELLVVRDKRYRKKKKKHPLQKKK